MTCHEHPCGSIMKLPISEVADRAARWVLTFQSPRALCLDPAGRVTVEYPGQAAECDLVGVYSPDKGLLALSRMIIDDLRFEAIERGLSPVRKRSAKAANSDNYELAS